MPETRPAGGLVWARRGALVSAIFVVAIALAVLAGWLADIPTLVQVLPGLVPMQFNTALGLLGAAIALAALAGGYRRIALGVSLATATWCVGIGAQMVLGIDFGIDRLFVAPQAMAVSTSSGRPSPVTLLALLLVSVSLAGAALPVRGTDMLFPAALAASFAAAIALVVLLDYAMGARRGSMALLSQVALHTALALALLSAGAAGLVWARISEEGETLPGWLPWAAGLACIAGTIGFQQSQHGIYLRQLKANTGFELEALSRDVGRDIDGRLLALERMARRLADNPSMPPPLWTHDARQYMENFPSFAEFSWVQAGGPVHRLYATLRGNEALPSLQGAVPVALGDKPVATTEVDNGKAWILVAFEWPARPAGRDKLVAVIDAKVLLATVIGDSVAPSLGITASLSGSPVFARGAMPASEGVVIETRMARHGGLDLRFVAWPTSLEKWSQEAQTEVFQVAAGALASVMVPLLLVMIRRTQLANRSLAERSLSLANSNRDLESFAYSVAHDLRAPLRHISAYSLRLDEALRGKIGKEEKRLLDVVMASAARQSSLVDDLLGYARAGSQAVETASLELAKVVPEIVALVREEADPEHRFAVEVNTPHRVLGDETLLGTALVNLVRNAFKFAAGNGSPSVSVRSEMLGDGRVALSVRDNGVGFDMKFAGKLFGVFQRLHSASEFPGTGIGLAIVRRSVERMGGTVSAQASPGEGAVFTLCIEGGKLP